MTRFVRFPSPLGPMFATAEEYGITHIEFLGAKYAPAQSPDWVEDPKAPDLAACVAQLGEYFAGTRQEFSLPLDIGGTEFQRSVWHALLTIPYGETRSYADIARQIGKPAAVRAVGAANGRNPLSIVAPCHRVVGSTGKLTGFAGGLGTKAFLLAHESGDRARLGADSSQ